MALTVKIPMEDVTITEADQLSHDFRRRGGVNVMVNGNVEFPFNDAGEMFFSAVAYAVCKGYNWVCDGGMFYAVINPDNICPVEWPDSQGEDGSQLTYADYFRADTQYQLEDGTWLFKMQRRGDHPDSGIALSDEDRRLFDDHFGGLLVKSEGLALIPTVVEA